MTNDLSLNPADVENMVRAVRLAQGRGAFQMEESAQLINSVSRLERWVATVRQAQEQADAQARQAQEQESSENDTETVSEADKKTSKKKEK